MYESKSLSKKYTKGKKTNKSLVSIEVFSLHENSFTNKIFQWIKNYYSKFEISWMNSDFVGFCSN